ncbi:hypothetical protein AB6A40_005165 [Gnathostoma spinigerum]|uniref:Uncharacterized protein n=1 Tax=Gnathostoma spinigerum TaxID=75299 RepID=A0ABD6EFL0_9BILA
MKSAETPFTSTVHRDGGDDDATVRIGIFASSVFLISLVVSLLVAAAISVWVKSDADIVSQDDRQRNIAKALYGSSFYLCNTTMEEASAKYVSPFRTLQVRAQPAILVRTAVLISSSCLMFCAWYRGCLILHSMVSEPSRPILFLIHSCLPLTVMHIWTMAVVVMHQIRLDAIIDLFITHNTAVFFSMAFMLLHICLDLCADHREGVIFSRRFHVRFACMLINLYITRPLNNSVLSYFETSDIVPCHPYVTFSPAFLEYAFIIVHLLFYSTFFVDVKDAEAVVRSDECVYIDESDIDLYEPKDYQIRVQTNVISSRPVITLVKK